MPILRYIYNSCLGTGVLCLHFWVKLISSFFAIPHTYLHNPQNHCYYELCPSSAIKNSYKTQRKLNLFPSSGARKRTMFRNVVFYSYLEFRTTDKVHNPNDSECCTPSSGPFRFYFCIVLPNFKMCFLNRVRTAVNPLNLKTSFRRMFLSMHIIHSNSHVTT
jgi:hypothetical protein